MIRLIVYHETEYTNLSQCIALGFFDGLHPGHKSVLEALAGEGLRRAVLTFSQRPQSFLSGGAGGSLTTAEERLALFEAAGVEALYELDFEKMRAIGAEEFLVLLRDTLSAKKICCGYNFRFGSGAKGDTALLKRFCDENAIELFVAPEVTFGGETLSSSAIRKKLENGEIETANRMLGRPFGFSLVVIHGRHLGTALGFPTINQILPPELARPKLGVYVSRVTVGTRVFRGVTNIGFKPTVGSDYCLAETNILGFEENLYGKRVRVELLSCLRCEQKFKDLDELRETVLRDRKKSAEFIEESFTNGF